MTYYGLVANLPTVDSLITLNVYYYNRQFKLCWAPNICFNCFTIDKQTIKTWFNIFQTVNPKRKVYGLQLHDYAGALTVKDNYKVNDFTNFKLMKIEVNEFDSNALAKIGTERIITI